MPGSPEQPPDPEIPQPPFLLSSRFASREASQEAYTAIENLLRGDMQNVTDFSVFQVIKSWPESVSKAPPSNKFWYVVALGNMPPPAIVQQVTEAINVGEPVEIPDGLVEELAAHRQRGVAQGPVTEHHHTVTLLRREGKQKQSRRRKPGTEEFS